MRRSDTARRPRRQFSPWAESLEPKLPLDGDGDGYAVGIDCGSDGPPQTMNQTATAAAPLDPPDEGPAEATFQLAEQVEADIEAEAMLLSEQMPTGVDAFATAPGPTPIQPQSAY